MVSLRQLRYLESLAETRHFGHAAKACAVSQPALSMQIKELEDELQVSLVERRKSGIGLTEQGEEIARRARTILASVRDLLDYAKHQEGVLSGVLKLGAIPSIAPYLLPAALPELQRRFPALNLQLRETLTENLVHELVTGDLDLILAALPIDDAEVETLYLFDDRFILATKATRRNQRLRHANADMLAHDRLLLLEEGHCLRDQALSYCHMLTPEARDVSARRASPPSCRWSPTATASRSCRRWRSRARSMPAATSACCAFARLSLSARSDLPGARLRRARATSFNSHSFCATSPRGRANKRSGSAKRGSASKRDSR
jgi:DNA-binding transcriptional LysR family regulator